jgi:transcriptional regulator with XRE-family HTH domain
MGRDMEETTIVRTVASNVRQARKAAGLSQEELAVAADVDRTYISQVERGKRNVTVVVLSRLARAVGTTAAVLVSDAQRIVEAARSGGLPPGLIKALGHAWVIPCAVPLYERWWGDEWINLISQF